MFLIDAIKHNVEKDFIRQQNDLKRQCFHVNDLKKRFKNCFIYLHDCFRPVSRNFASVHNKTSFVSFRVMFPGGIKNFIQNKREKCFILFFFHMPNNITVKHIRKY